MVSAEIELIANWVFTVGSILFILALIPTLLHGGASVPASSSALTAAVLFAYGIVYFLLQFDWFTILSAIALAVTWALVFALRRSRPSGTVGSGPK